MVNKIDVATEQLEAAIKLFVAKKYAAAATLAGAAEEIFGTYVRISGSLPDMESMAVGLVKIHERLTGHRIATKDAKAIINRTKNSLKHMDGTEDAVIEDDLQEEAMVLLWRAVHNYDRLNLPFNGTIAEFPGNVRDV